MTTAERDVPILDVVVPVHNEQTVLAHSIHRLHEHLSQTFPLSFRITIADNASVDGTAAVAAGLAAELPGVRVVRLAEKGRGRALRTVWSSSDAPVLAYMDVDLSTDLGALSTLVAPVASGHSELAIGTRLGRGSRVVRGAKREIISRCYNLILRAALAVRFSDASAVSKLSALTLRNDCSPMSRTPAGSSTLNCWCSHSEADCGFTRCRSTGLTMRTVESTSSPPPSPT